MHGVWLWFLHVSGADDESGNWYGFWSGFGSDLGLFAAVAVFLKNKNCHAKWCWRLGRHPFKHFVFCGRHHPDVK